MVITLYPLRSTYILNYCVKVRLDFFPDVSTKTTVVIQIARGADSFVASLIFISWYVRFFWQH